MHNEQNTVYKTDRMQAFFALDHPVFTDNDVRIAENFSGFVETDAVFTIFARFLLPFHSKRIDIRFAFGIYNAATAGFFPELFPAIERSTWPAWPRDSIPFPGDTFSRSCECY